MKFLLQRYIFFLKNIVLLNNFINFVFYIRELYGRRFAFKVINKRVL